MCVRTCRRTGDGQCGDFRRGESAAPEPQKGLYFLDGRFDSTLRRLEQLTWTPPRRCRRGSSCKYSHGEVEDALNVKRQQLPKEAAPAKKADGDADGPSTYRRVAALLKATPSEFDAPFHHSAAFLTVQRKNRHSKRQYRNSTRKRRDFETGGGRRNRTPPSRARGSS